MTMADQQAPVTTMPRIGDPAPAFTASTTQGEINFPADYAGQWVIFFSPPRRLHPGVHDRVHDLRARCRMSSPR